MNFKATEAFVWIWLPNATTPVVAGKLEIADANHHDFFYGKSYSKNSKAIAFDQEEMPLQLDIRFTSNKALHYVFRDALPDAWGQRILLNRYPSVFLTPINMLLLSSSDRIGALHFQDSADSYKPQYENHASLEELMEAASYVELGKSIPENLGVALFHGTSVGGARPKALIETNQKKYIAKFSSSTDLFPIVQAEFAVMWLAKKIGINAANVEIIQTAGKNVLLVERFDRMNADNGWTRKFVTSALSLLRLDESEGRYASYLDLSEQIRKHARNPTSDLKEMFQRMVFNILVGNTDDHAKNHSFFWDGQYYSLTPAYDICPYLRSGQQATQAMTVGELGSYSLLTNALSAASYFQLSNQEAQQIIDEMVMRVKDHWHEACELAKLSRHQSAQLMGRAILNPYCFYTSP